MGQVSANSARMRAEAARRRRALDPTDPEAFILALAESGRGRRPMPREMYGGGPQAQATPNALEAAQVRARPTPDPARPVVPNSPANRSPFFGFGRSMPGPAGRETPEQPPGTLDRETPEQPPGTLDREELVEYRRNLLARMGVADAKRRRARVSGDPASIAEAENEFRALQNENVDLGRATRTPMSVEEVEAGRERLRAAFPGAIRGVQRQISEEQREIIPRLMGAASGPYGQYVVPGAIRRYAELDRELADSRAREESGLRFSPYTPQEPDAGAVARVAAAQRARITERNTRSQLEDMARQAEIDAASAGAAMVGAESEEAARRRESARATSKFRTEAEVARSEGEAAAARRAQEAAGPPQQPEDMRRKIEEIELRNKMAEALGQDVAPNADVVRETSRLLADTFGELSGRWIGGGKDDESLRAAEDAVSRLEGLFKHDPEAAASIAEQYRAAVGQSVSGESEISDPTYPTAIDAIPGGVLYETVINGRPITPTGLKRAYAKKRRLADLYKRLQAVGGAGAQG